MRTIAGFILAAGWALGLGLSASAMPGGGSSPPPQTQQGWPGSRPEKPRDYKDAMDLIAQGKCAEALPLLDKAAAKSPKDADIYNQIGFCLRTIGKAAAEGGDAATAQAKYSESFNAYRQALTLDPNHKGARDYVGELFLLMDRPADADAQLEQLKKLCPRGCVERDTLQKAIDDYKAKHPAPAQ
ncbi:MAG: hypothetical protein U1E87_03030 [Alphaproteobacteria bacterium]